MKKKKLGTAFVLLGILLLLAAAGLTAYNIWDNNRAGDRSDALLEQWQQESGNGGGEEASSSGEDASEQEGSSEGEAGSAGSESSAAPSYEGIPDYILDPGMDMPTVEVDGVSCIASIEIPAIGISLPVISEWNYPNLRIAPCRYSGSAYTNDLVIAGHNYARHFGGLRYLSAGSQVILTDAEGHRFTYTVSYVEVLDPSQVEEMLTGDWDLTLFTCTLDTATRVTVRCRRNPLS